MSLESKVRNMVGNLDIDLNVFFSLYRGNISIKCCNGLEGSHTATSTPDYHGLEMDFFFSHLIDTKCNLLYCGLVCVFYVVYNVVFLFVYSPPFPVTVQPSAKYSYLKKLKKKLKKN